MTPAAALTVGMVGVAGPVIAAPPASSSAPVAMASAAEPMDGTVTLSYPVNRAEKQVRQPVSCALDDVTIACGAVTGSSGLAPGSDAANDAFVRGLVDALQPYCPSQLVWSWVSDPTSEELTRVILYCVQNG